MLSFQNIYATLIKKSVKVKVHNAKSFTAPHPCEVGQKISRCWNPLPTTPAVVLSSAIAMAAEVRRHSIITG